LIGVKRNPPVERGDEKYRYCTRWFDSWQKLEHVVPGRTIILAELLYQPRQGSMYLANV
jgi:hypothetical protein